MAKVGLGSHAHHKPHLHTARPHQDAHRHHDSTSNNRRGNQSDHHAQHSHNQHTTTVSHNQRLAATKPRHSWNHGTRPSWTISPKLTATKSNIHKAQELLRSKKVPGSLEDKANYDSSPYRFAIYRKQSKMYVHWHKKHRSSNENYLISKTRSYSYATYVHSRTTGHSQFQSHKPPSTKHKQTSPSAR